MDFEDVRKLTITALFSDDLLFEQLVLKGGNAMTLVHGISPRASLDLDFSLEKDFEDLPDVQARMARALADRFASVGFVPFDIKLIPRPSVQKDEAVLWWGGYQLNFKLINEKRYRSFGSEKERLRRESLVIAPNQLKVFTVDFSKWEFTGGKVKAEFDDYTIFVYSPAMIALEKVRAICQQMEEYPPTGKTKRPRARDFFDIYTVVTKTGFRFGAPENLDMMRLVFAAKEVPLPLLGKVKDQREFHRPDWPRVRGAVAARLEEFDYYFEFVLREIEPLHALWME
jgi:Nucleotidyl transferase AbiEii toxin, Type IV TA system